jgi:hypothetical protein
MKLDMSGGYENFPHRDGHAISSWRMLIISMLSAIAVGLFLYLVL